MRDHPIKLSCIVENCAMRGSALWGEHGTAFLVESSAGSLLFDTGQSGTVLLHNAEVMGLQLDQVDALALSHAHYDHTGGLSHFLAHCQPGLPLFASPDLFRPRFSRRGAETTSIGLALTQESIARQAALRLSAEPVEIFPGVWTTGEIRHRTETEGRSSQHGVFVAGEWQPDPYQDDLSLVIDAPQGLVLVCGCCHAGLLNTLAQVRRIFGMKIAALIGGTHLVSASSKDIGGAIDQLKTLDQDGMLQLYLNHCTGEQAFLAMAQAFVGRVRSFPAGASLTL